MSGRVIGGRYSLAEPIGRGAMGVVWRARDELLDRDVAVKEVLVGEALGEEERANAYRRTLREAKTAARLSHRGVVTVYDVAEEDGRPWIIMELVHASSLDQVIAESGPLTPRRAGRIGEQVLAALASAHSAGVLHRDVKPSNVLLGADDRAVLTDFGIAEFQGDPRLTQTGMVMGSPGFTAPERIRGGAATPASDLWSLGATLYTAVEGRGPYEARGGAITTMSAIINEDAPAAASAGPLSGVIAALLRRDPASRPDAMTAARMIADIMPLLPDRPPGWIATQVSAASGAGAMKPVGAGAADAAFDAIAAGAASVAGARGGGAGGGGAAGGGDAARGAGGAVLEENAPGHRTPAAKSALARVRGASAGMKRAAAGMAGAGARAAAGAGAGARAGASAGAEPAASAVAGAGAVAGAEGAANSRTEANAAEAPTAISPSLTSLDGVQSLYASPRTTPSEPVVPSPSASPLSSPLRPAGSPPVSSPGQPSFAPRLFEPGPQGAPSRRRRGGWKLSVAAVAVVAAAGGSIAAFSFRHHQTTAAAITTTGTPVSPPGPIATINQPALGTLPAGFTRETVTPQDADTQAGFTIGVPAGWQPVRRTLKDTIIFAPGHGGHYLQIDLTAHVYDDMLAEARYIRANALASGHFPGYHQLLVKRTPIRGYSGAVWKFTWQDVNGVRMQAEDLLFTATTAAGPQSYALYLSAPAASWNADLPIFDQELRTFQLVTGS